MVSFIIPTYNLDDALLDRCIQSICDQGLPKEDYEIIVVDDDSMISPQAVVNDFYQINIRLYRQEHKRQGAARNLGLNHAKGEWIRFVDGDDYLPKDSTKRLLEIAEENKVDLVLFDHKRTWTMIPENITSTKGKVTVYNSGDEYMLKKHLFGSCCTMMFKRDLCAPTTSKQPLRFTENIYCEDEEFATKLVWRAKKMVKTTHVGYMYYQRSNSTTLLCDQDHREELCCNSMLVLGHLLTFEREAGARPHKGLRRKIRYLALDIMRRALREEDWEKHFERIRKGLKEMRLYPLPMAREPLKYHLFNMLIRCKWGRTLIHLKEGKAE